MSDETVARAEGGPLDGQVLGEAGPDHFDVTMADRSTHRYVRDAPLSGRDVRYRYAGRVRG